MKLVSVRRITAHCHFGRVPFLLFFINIIVFDIHQAKLFLMFVITIQSACHEGVVLWLIFEIKRYASGSKPVLENYDLNITNRSVPPRTEFPSDRKFAAN